MATDVIIIIICNKSCAVETYAKNIAAALMNDYVNKAIF